MTSIIPSYATAPLASLIGFFRLFKHNPQAEWTEQPGLERYRTAVPHPWFSGVVASRLPSSNDQALIQEQITYFNNQGVNTFTWWLEPGLPVDEWGNQLLPLGFAISHDPPGMVCDLRRLHSDLSTPASLKVIQVNDQPTLDIWTKTFVKGFGLPESYTISLYNLLAGFGLNAMLKHYLGYLDGEPSAAASLFISDGIAGIYNVGVMEQARRKGLGAAITLVPLLEARDMGYTLGALQSSEMGFNVYQRLGFQMVSNVTHFYHPAARV